MKWFHLILTGVSLSLPLANPQSVQTKDFTHQVNSSGTSVHTLNLEVISSTPVYNNVVRKIPREVCEDVKIPITKSTNQNILGGLLGGAIGRNIGDGHGQEAATAAGTLLGSGADTPREIGSGILGAVIGKQFGKGKGKDAAIAAGALLGAQMGTARQDTGRYRIERQCRIEYDSREEKVLGGYTNRAVLFGSEIEKFSASPLKTIPVELQAKW